MKLTKQRIETIITTLILLLLAFIRYQMFTHGIGKESPWLAVTMFVATAIYTFFGCMLQTFNHHKLTISLGVITFFVLCSALFYSVSFLDFLTFFICMAQVIRKSTKHCQCIKEQCGVNPLE